jgi:hypothetical protein
MTLNGRGGGDEGFESLVRKHVRQRLDERSEVEMRRIRQGILRRLTRRMRMQNKKIP